MLLSKNLLDLATVTALGERALLVGLSALALTACVVGDGAEPALDTGAEAIGTEAAALDVACVLGDGYVIPSGGHITVYPVSCGSDCRDYPNGGFARELFCVNGVVRKGDPALPGGSLAPLVTASYFNGYSRCTALPTASYTQSADRKSCIPL